MTYTPQELTALAKCSIILRNEVRASTDVLTALARVERAISSQALPGTGEYRAAYAKAHEQLGAVDPIESSPRVSEALEAVARAQD